MAHAHPEDAMRQQPPFRRRPQYQGLVAHAGALAALTLLAAAPAWGGAGLAPGSGTPRVLPCLHGSPGVVRHGAGRLGGLLRLRGGDPEAAGGESFGVGKGAVAAPKSFARRDLLLEIQQEAQDRWERERTFEADAPEAGPSDAGPAPPKYFVTFPYPYMNGLLHLGHAFSLSKAEFAVGFERMQGKKTLWPFAFHCTGMPIQAAADALRRELAAEANPEGSNDGVVVDAPGAGAGAADPDAATEAVVAPGKGGAPGGRFVSAKSKLSAKRGKGSQREVLEAMGVPSEEVAQFADAEHWLKYFPPLAQRDVTALGAKVDWRRSFITTEAAPWYDAFVKWQFRTLRARGKVQFGKRLSIFSPIDGQICADHDRASGEGVCPQEYTAIKMELLELPKAVAALEDSIKGSKVFMLAATLRPETMYGQTNCWVLPHMKDGSPALYGVFRISADEVVVCSRQAARNLAFQGTSLTPGETVKQEEWLGDVAGADLLGARMKAPLSARGEVRALPLLNIAMGKGTGIVTSVPSDSPEDYIALMDLKNKAAMREKYGLADEWVMDLEPIPILEMPFPAAAGNAEVVGGGGGEGGGAGGRTTSLSAVDACKEFKVKSQNDRVQLEAAKGACYRLGFSYGTLLVGPFAGEPVQAAKVKVREQLIASGEALSYAEPETEVVSRSGDTCVVALTDQWYLKYGEAEWRSQVEGHMKSTLELYSPDTRARFDKSLAWLGEWACSRSFGLGTRLPWDEACVIESLSDSTIYTALYTIIHILHRQEEKLVPDDLTDEDWDAVFLGGTPAPDSKVPGDILAEMRREFSYWYPVDLRVSGRDLIANHLLFYLYAHAAIFPEPHWPRGIRTNGFVMLNNEKMSKSTGNFLTLQQALALYSADALRFALAAAGDSNEDANFEHSVANAAILKLTNHLALLDESLKDLASGAFRSGPSDELLVDKVFANELRVHVQAAASAYSRHQFRDALIAGWDLLQHARDRYRSMAGAQGMHGDLVQEFLRLQTLVLAPVCPHVAERCWARLGKTTTVVDAAWPEQPPADPALARLATYLDKTLSDLRVKADKVRKRKKAGAESAVSLSRAEIYVASSLEDWQQAVLAVLQEEADTPGGGAFDKLFKQALLADSRVKATGLLPKTILPFAQKARRGFGQQLDASHRQLARIDMHLAGDASALEASLPFDEAATLTELLPFLSAELSIPQDALSILPWPPLDSRLATALALAAPGRPSPSFE